MNGPAKSRSGRWLRCVVLHHQVPTATNVRDGDHLDWMFEIVAATSIADQRAPTTVAERLRTFATPVIEWHREQTIPFHRLLDHRAAYLEYEGPISRNRGHVSRIAEGLHAMETLSPDCDPNEQVALQTVVRMRSREASHGPDKDAVIVNLRLTFQTGHWKSAKASSDASRYTAGVACDGFLTIQRLPADESGVDLVP